jgi:hypothetical protein
MDRTIDREMFIGRAAGGLALACLPGSLGFSARAARCRDQDLTTTIRWIVEVPREKAVSRAPLPRSRDDPLGSRARPRAAGSRGRGSRGIRGGAPEKPSFYGAWFGPGLLHLRRGRHEVAAAASRSVLSLNPDNAGARSLLDRALRPR